MWGPCLGGGESYIRLSLLCYLKHFQTCSLYPVFIRQGVMMINTIFTPGDSEGQGRLACLVCGVAKSRTWLSDWTTEGLMHPFICLLGFPGSSAGKETTCNAGDLDSTPGSGRSPSGGHGSPLQYSCLENPHGLRCLAGYSPWRPKKLDWAMKHIQLWNLRDCQAPCQLLRAEWEMRPDIPWPWSMQLV